MKAAFITNATRSISTLTALILLTLGSQMAHAGAYTCLKGTDFVMVNGSNVYEGNGEQWPITKCEQGQTFEGVTRYTNQMDVVYVTRKLGKVSKVEIGSTGASDDENLTTCRPMN